MLALLLPALALTALGAALLWPHGDRPTIGAGVPQDSFRTVTVTEVLTDETDPTRQVRARVDDGDEQWVSVPPEYLTELREGARLRVVELPDLPAGVPPYVFVDFERGPPLAVLTALYVVLVVLVARWRGFASLLGLGLSLAVIAGFTLPALLLGRPAVGVALVSASAIMFVVLYLAHGFTLKTSTALIGTLAGLVATALIAAWASGAAELTGLSGEYGLDLISYAPQVRLRDVLLCGMVLAGLGVLNDVTITQASAVWELRAAAPRTSRREVFASAMRIGRDHIASTVYTIVFAYLGASLPLVLLVSMSDRSVVGALTSGELAEEVARTLVGSIGLVLAIPLTTAVGVLLAGPGAGDTAPAPGPAPGSRTRD
ncbi:MAG TPA: YibE/F family protein [Actinotalea sp.]|nr:YibE/F family protein [Actinotalea sp.]